jgi:hypothetical protein
MKPSISMLQIFQDFKAGQSEGQSERDAECQLRLKPENSATLKTCLFRRYAYKT